MGARVYLPSTGRFLSVDPVRGGTQNDYVYPVDPVNGNDFSGKFMLFGSNPFVMFSRPTIFNRNVVAPKGIKWLVNQLKNASENFSIIGEKGGSNAGRNFTDQVKDSIRQSDYNKEVNSCPNCGKSMNPLDPSSSHVDHIFPKTSGGTNTPNNGQTLCPSCNMSKGAKIGTEFFNNNPTSLNNSRLVNITDSQTTRQEIKDFERECNEGQYLCI